MASEPPSLGARGKAGREAVLTSERILRSHLDVAARRCGRARSGPTLQLLPTPGARPFSRARVPLVRACFKTRNLLPPRVADTARGRYFARLTARAARRATHSGTHCTTAPDTAKRANKCASGPVGTLATPHGAQPRP